MMVDHEAARHIAAILSNASTAEEGVSLVAAFVTALRAEWIEGYLGPSAEARGAAAERERCATEVERCTGTLVPAPEGLDLAARIRALGPR